MKPGTLLFKITRGNRHEYKFVASKVNGRIKAIHVKNGEKFHANQLLIEMDVSHSNDKSEHEFKGKEMIENKDEVEGEIID